MDKDTIEAYSKDAEGYLKRYSKQQPFRIIELIDAFFVKKTDTIDIGCASGRDIEVLNSKGHIVTGIDIVPEFVDHCKRIFPDNPILQDSLPKLEKIKDQAFINVLLCAVLMHLSGEDLIEAVSNIVRITAPEGRILISIRLTREKDERESDGRLFSAIAPSKLITLFEGFGTKLLFQESTEQMGPDGEKTWLNFVFEKIDLAKKSGIESIQEIIAKDKKDTSYKLALLRVLNYMARYEQGSVHHHAYNHVIYIPLKRVAFYWLQFFYPLITNPNPIIQSKSHGNNLAITQPILDLKDQFGSLPQIIKSYQEGDHKKINRTLTVLAKTIKNQPMRYIGDSSNPIFEFWSQKDASLFNFPDDQNGFIGVPTKIWHDLIFFNQWIEDSLILHWARFTEDVNQDENLATYIKLLSSPVEDQRSTAEIRHLFENDNPTCIYSQKTVKDYQVDHMIPYFHWKNNDLWNLMPSSAKLNLQKKDRIPTPALVKKSKDLIIENWKLYQKFYPSRFQFQIEKAFGQFDRNWENAAFMTFYEMISRIESHKQIDSWEP